MPLNVMRSPDMGYLDTIHSAVVFTDRSMSWFVTRRLGRYEPMPTMPTLKLSSMLLADDERRAWQTARFAQALSRAAQRR